MAIIEKRISVPYGSTGLKGDIFSSGNGSIRMVLLHGAGLGTRDRYRQLRTHLAEASIQTLAFDFIGFGETGGDLHGTSLESRTEQARAVIGAAGIGAPFCLLGASMGAYTAIRLLPYYPVESLVLFVPAVYHPDAYTVPFGPEFTRVIRRPESWADSDAWDILRAYRGRLLIVAAERDDVIPRDVIRRIFEAGKNASRREVHTVRKSPHLLIHYLSQNGVEYAKVLDLIKAYIQG